MTDEEFKQLKQIAKNVSNSAATISWGLLALQFVLAFGLKYLWNIMNLLQFLIFMVLWPIRIPIVTKVVIREFRSIAFLEFIPTEWFKNEMRNLLSVDKPEDKCKSGVCDAQGAEVYGTTDLIENMGVMLLIGCVILAVIVLLILLKILKSKCECVRAGYEAIKSKVFYNSILRFVLQSSLKL